MLFNYKIIDKEKNELTGILDANNRTKAISILISKGYSILELKAKKESLFNYNLFLRVKSKDLIIFSRQIATLFESGISALQAFNLVSNSIQDKYFKDILIDISSKIEQGYSLEKAFSVHKKIFGEFFISIIIVGEQSGTLPRSFAYLADYIEKKEDLKSKIKKALTYPIFVIVLFIIVMFVILITVIPQISTILLQSGVELPLLTQYVIAASDFARENLFLIIFSVLGSIVLLVMHLQTDYGKRSFDNFILNVPIIGRMFRQFYVVRFANNLEVMLSGGVPIVKSLDILSRVMKNDLYKNAVLDIEKNVKNGMTLSNAIEKQNVIDRNISQLIRVGEETGELKKMVSVIGKFYEKQLNGTIDLVLDLIQPTIIVFLGTSVGLLIGSVIVPIYSVSNVI